MKILNRYIVKEHLYPFISALLALLFVLLANFLLRSMDRFLGKGLAFSTIFKFILFHSASILSLAIPMAMLVATMMAFGRFSSDNEITGFKSTGVSYYNFLKPGLFFGIVVVLVVLCSIILRF